MGRDKKSSTEEKQPTRAALGELSGLSWDCPSCRDSHYNTWMTMAVR
jgi:hypothetical protein